MSMLELTRQYILPAALALLPDKMRSREAERMVLCIALQESRFQHRRQIGGPARGFWQFEREGVLRLMHHQATKEHLRAAVLALAYDAGMASDDISLHAAIEHNDVLACVLARLNIWWLPQPLPTTEAEAWEQYLKSWRPGRARPETWAECWRLAGEQL